VKHPQRSVQLIRDALEDLQPVREVLDATIALLTETKEYIRLQEQVQLSRDRGLSLLQRIQDLSGKARTALATAEDLNRNADLALSEGEIRLQQAQDELRNDRFEAAREKIEQAGYSFSESLTFREDPEVRRLIDERIPSIAEDIIFRQNEQIVTEVRDLINEGRELFFTEKFIEAEQVLKRAQSRWRLTHTEDDPEVELWLTRVERALTATSGAVIEEEEPLYADMMQVLNLAREGFQQGRSLYEQGDQDGALPFFRQAEQKIEYIKEPFPNNQAAGVLYLRILQYTQPQDFESIFRERFQEARSKLNSSPEEAYRELQVLQEIRSDFPGLQDAIFQAEIATGIRQPPPDPQKLARARDLYSQAQRIVQQDIRAQFPIALTYLNEAIKLDPDYSDAIVLKDRIQTGQGGQVSVVLSSIDQQKLRQAENLFIDGRYFEARVLVEQLWQNPENRSNPRLVELRRRIESQL
jgi:tetratricopeptide (TPR) repeat protein